MSNARIRINLLIACLKSILLVSCLLFIYRCGITDAEIIRKGFLWQIVCSFSYNFRV